MKAKELAAKLIENPEAECYYEGYTYAGTEFCVPLVSVIIVSDKEIEESLVEQYQLNSHTLNDIRPPQIGDFIF